MGNDPPALNATMLQFFHWYYPADGSLWNHLAEEAEALKRSGFDAVWLPPAYKGAKGASSEGYDCYDLYDLGEFEQKNSVRTKYGTRDEYLQAIKTARTAGLQVLADVVLNHKAGADAVEKFRVRMVNPANRREVVSDAHEVEGWTRFTFPGRQGRYSDFTWSWWCFTGVDTLHSHDVDGIFTIEQHYGEEWEPLVSPEHGNFDFLMFCDIEFRHPAVREEMKRWGAWYVETTGVDGFRLDALKHINLLFVNEWLDTVRAAAGRELFAVGEYWAPYAEPLLQYIEATGGRMTLFDAPLHYTFFQASRAGQGFDLRQIFDNSLVRHNPLLSVTFVDNHDTMAFQSLESPVETWFKPLAYAVILLRREGFPCVFYPDLYGAAYTAETPEGPLEVVLEPVPNLTALVSARKQFAWGEQHDYFGDANRVGWVRRGLEERGGSGCAVVVSNGPGGRLRMAMGPRFEGVTLLDLLGHSTEAVLAGENGEAEFPVPAASVSVWVDGRMLNG
jgi:alpha-amylase